MLLPKPSSPRIIRAGLPLRPTQWLPACAALLLSFGASAHVTLERPEAPAGSYYKAVLRVPHGCSGAATTGVRVRIPDGVVSVKPQPKPGWTLETERGPLAEPYESHGQTIGEGVREVRWYGGNLPDAQFDEFAILMKLPAGAGRTLAFATVQDCTGGAVERWIGLPAAGQSAHDLPRPAPLLRLTDPVP